MAKYEKNRLPDTIKGLFSQVEDLINGSTLYAVSIGLMHNPPDALQGALNTARAKQADWLNASTALSMAVREDQLANKMAADFLARAKKSITSVLGNRFLPVMLEAGFKRGSLALPADGDGRLYMAQKLIGFLAEHPECVDTRAEVNVTVAGAQLVYDRLEAARAARNSAETAAAMALDARDAEVRSLRLRVSLLKAELRNALPADSPVWYAFGLNAPGDPLRPDPIAGELVTQPLGEGTLVLSWPAAPRATRYNVYAQVVGRDEAPLRVAAVRDRAHILTGLPSGTTVKVHVAGVNAAGEGEPTEPVAAVIP